MKTLFMMFVFIYEIIISNTFDNKGEVEIFNAYDPIRPPENIGDKPILYLDILSLF
jgi:hypothetical protein